MEVPEQPANMAPVAAIRPTSARRRDGVATDPLTPNSADTAVLLTAS